MPSIGQIVRAGLIVGLAWNLLGWIGNQLILGDHWRDAMSYLHYAPWRGTVWRHIVSLAPDFIYGIVMAWVYVYIAESQGPSFKAGLKAALIVFIAGAFTAYLGIANSGLLPWPISLYTTIVAFVAVFPGAWLVDRLLGPSMN